MTIERFKEMLDCHGTKLDTWPKSEQLPARQLLLHSEEARTLLKFDEGIEALLKASPAKKAPAFLVGNIMDRIKK
ncbi:hypothetical protein [Cohaesibacter sp. ES.047]|uniref:hypothetical protein n=1 Tax=Cohaesibacter sp. ES.047 TaxID=1798205 RepID=UPI0012FD2C90|nr:hypothetical protein [Cohaesibacter sp. ES.047]